MNLTSGLLAVALCLSSVVLMFMLLGVKVVVAEKDPNYLFTEHPMQMSGCVEKKLYTDFYFKPLSKDHLATGDQLLVWKCGGPKEDTREQVPTDR